MGIRQDHVIISFQVHKDEREAFRELCEKRDMSQSNKLRRMVREEIERVSRGENDAEEVWS